MSKTLNHERRLDALRRETVQAKLQPAASTPAPASVPPRPATEPGHPPVGRVGDSHAEAVGRGITEPGTPPIGGVGDWSAEDAGRGATAPTSLAAPEPMPEAIIASVACKEPAAGFSQRPGVAHNAVRSTHHRSSILTFVIACSATLGIVRIVRTGLLRPDASAHTQKPISPPASPLAAVSVASDVSVVPLPPPRVQEVRNPVAEAPSSEPKDAALAEAPRPPIAAMSVTSDVSVAPPSPPRVQEVRNPVAEAPSSEPKDAALAEATRVYNLMETALHDAARTLSASQTEPFIPAN